jgi:hypothetical protein
MTELEPPPGDSRVQREAEILMVAWLSNELGCELAPRRIYLPEGSWLEVDAFSESPLLICEAWAHHGPPKAAQKMKIMNDAMKLLAARRVVGDDARAVLLFADERAASRFRAGTWHASAIREARIEILVARLPDDIVANIQAAQLRQYR